MIAQLQRRIREPLRPYVYRDFGPLVSRGESATFGNLMGFIPNASLFVQGVVARSMYRSLQKMHDAALHGPAKALLDTVARILTRRTEPQVKLH